MEKRVFQTVRVELIAIEGKSVNFKKQLYVHQTGPSFSPR
jgi:hypothetical protein